MQPYTVKFGYLLDRCCAIPQEVLALVLLVVCRSMAAGCDQDQKAISRMRTGQLASSTFHMY